MQSITTADGRYLLVEQDDVNAEGTAQAVVYDLRRPPPNHVWDRWSYEAGLGEGRPPEPAPGPPGEPGAPVVPPIYQEPGRVYRVTSDGDGPFAPRFYSYWSNAYIAGDGAVIVFAGHQDGRPRFFRVDLASGHIDRLGPLVGYGGTTEGWYWDAAGRITLCDGPRLRRISPVHQGHDEVLFDISGIRPGCDLWQAHSSDDGRVHSATVRRITSDGPYQKIGTVVSVDGRMQVFDAIGDLDESHIDGSGQFVIIEESHDNRIISLASGDTRWIRNAEGALSHIDCGPSYMVGEDDQRGACVRIALHDLNDRLPLFSTWGMGHVSVRGGRCLNSDATHLSLVALDGAGKFPLLEHGMVGSGYDYQVRANLDPTGRVACFMSNRAGQFDVYLAQV